MRLTVRTGAIFTFISAHIHPKDATNPMTSAVAPDNKEDSISPSMDAIASSPLDASDILLLALYAVTPMSTHITTVSTNAAITRDKRIMDHIFLFIVLPPFLVLYRNFTTKVQGSQASGARLTEKGRLKIVFSHILIQGLLDFILFFFGKSQKEMEFVSCKKFKNRRSLNFGFV